MYVIDVRTLNSSVYSILHLYPVFAINQRRKIKRIIRTTVSDQSSRTHIGVSVFLLNFKSRI